MPTIIVSRDSPLAIVMFEHQRIVDLGPGATRELFRHRVYLGVALKR